MWASVLRSGFLVVGPGISDDDSSLGECLHFLLDFFHPLICGGEKLLVEAAAGFAFGFNFARFRFVAFRAFPQPLAELPLAVAAEDAVGYPAVTSVRGPAKPLGLDLYLSPDETANPEEVVVPETA